MSDKDQNLTQRHKVVNLGASELSGGSEGPTLTAEPQHVLLGCCTEQPRPSKPQNVWQATMFVCLFKCIVI
jgi:hypothetical protein